MATIRIPTTLRTLTGGTSTVEVEGATVGEVLANLDAAHPGFKDRLFDDTGALTNFVSDDRYQSADGKVFKPYRWSTPVHGYRDYHGRKLAEFGEASWKMPDGELSYGRFQLLDVSYNDREP